MHCFRNRPRLPCLEILRGKISRDPSSAGLQPTSSPASAPLENRGTCHGCRERPTPRPLQAPEAPHVLDRQLPAHPFSCPGILMSFKLLVPQLTFLATPDLVVLPTPLRASHNTKTATSTLHLTPGTSAGLLAQGAGLLAQGAAKLALKTEAPLFQGSIHCNPTTPSTGSTGRASTGTSRR